MVSGPNAGARTAALPYRVRKTILSIKEIVGNHSHSDADIYSVLKESNMDPNQTAHKLLKRDHFREVKRKTDKEKENLWNNAYSESRNLYGHTEPVAKPQDKSNRNRRIGVYAHNASRAINRKFGVVRDNRVNQKVDEESRSASQTNFYQVASDSSSKRFSTQISKQKYTDARSTELQVPLHGASETQKSASSCAMNTRKQLLVGGKNAIVSRRCLQLLGQRSTNSSPSTDSASSKSVVGVNSKSTDPVHVPSSNSKPSESIYSKRKVGDVGVRHKSAQNSLPDSAAYSSTSVAPGLKKQGVVRSDFGRTTTPSTASVPSKSVVGVNSKSTDPVHVPSSNSKPSESVDSIKRKVGDVGVRHKSAQNSLPHSAAYSSTSVAPGLKKQGVVRSDFGWTTTPSTASVSSKSVVGVNSKSTDPVHVPSSNSKPSESVDSIKRKVGDVGVRHKSAQTSLPHSAAYSSTSVAPGLKKQGVVRSDFGRTTTPSTASVSSKSVVGVNSKSTDPVHVPSSNSKPSESDSIKPKVDVGVRHKSAQNSLLYSAAYSSTSVAPGLRKHGVVRSVVFGRTTTAHAMNNQSNQAAANQTLTANAGHNKHFWANHQNGRIHQQAKGRQKASQPNKEWKLKSSQKLNVPDLAVPGQSDLSLSLPSHNSSGARMEALVLPEKFAQINVSSEDHVIIPQHLQVPEVDKSRFFFGSFGMELDLCNSSTPGLKSFSDGHEHENEAAIRLSDANASIHDNYDGGVISVEDHVRRSGSESLGSDVIAEANEHDKVSASPPNLNDNSEIGLVQSSMPASDRLKLQQEENDSTLPNFLSLGLHPMNGEPASSANLVQQQHSISQMYQQVHIPDFSNFIQYRQVYPPVYVPPMAVPDFSSNLAYHHPTNGNNYLVFPGVSSHPPTNNLKYAPSQINRAPVGGPASYGNLTNPAVYPFGTSRSMGPSDLDDVSRIKYKDGNMFVPSPQVDTSVIWIQTPSELSNMQSAPYYNMPGQAPHAAFLPSSGSSSFINAPTVQSAHLPFPGLYHQPQPITMSNPHPLVHPQIQAMGCDLPVSQVGAYQQSQPNWTSNY